LGYQKVQAVHLETRIDIRSLGKVDGVIAKSFISCTPGGKLSTFLSTSVVVAKAKSSGLVIHDLMSEFTVPGIKNTHLRAIISGSELPD